VDSSFIARYEQNFPHDGNQCYGYSIGVNVDSSVLGGKCIIFLWW